MAIRSDKCAKRWVIRACAKAPTFVFKYLMDWKWKSFASSTINQRP